MNRFYTMLVFLMMFGTSSAQYVLIPDSALRMVLRGNAPSAFSGNFMDTTNVQLQAVTNLNYNGSVLINNFDGLQYLNSVTNISFYKIGADSATFFPPNLTGMTLSSNTLKKIYNVPNTVWSMVILGASPLRLIDVPSFVNNINITFNHFSSISNRNCVANFHPAFYSGRTISIQALESDTVVVSGGATDLNVSGIVGIMDLTAFTTNDLYSSVDCNVLFLMPLCSKISINGQVDSLNDWPSNLSTLMLNSLNDDGLNLKKGIPPTVQNFDATSFLMGELDSIPNSMRNFRCWACGLTRLPPLPDSLLTLSIPYNYLPCFPWLPDGLTNFLYQPQYLPDNTIAPFYCLPNWTLPWAFNHPNGFIGCPPTLTNCRNIAAIKGNVFLDIDSNGIKSSFEPYFPGVRMKTLRSGSFIEYISVSGDSGRFLQYAVPGSHTVEPILPKYGAFSTPIATCNVVDFGDTVLIPDVGIKMLTDVADLSLTAAVTPLPRPGFGSTLFITCTNVGTKLSNGSVHFDIDPAFTINSSIPVADTLSGQSIAWDVTGMLPGAVYSYSVSLTCLPSTPINSSVIIDGIAYPVDVDTFPPDNFVHLILEVRGSFDPNDKQVVPAGFFTPAQVSQGDYLDYTIRFQNTGTADAVHIEISDSLSSFFDISSLELLATSHQPYSWRIEDNTLIVRFDSIMLPDSNTNEMLSHGFVRYRVKPISSILVGEVIENNADIYFDFNVPVRTNTTNTTIGWPSGINEYSINESAFIYPNPVRNTNGILYLRTKQKEPLTIHWNDQAGRLIYTDRIPAYENTIRLPILSPGIYFITLSGETMEKKFVKVIILN
ncbi:MAG: T9SS type A sorting domain-containing protein [Bacteroidetes bacterium]|nr:T9SS type A sorting domain-containing protein [Bacteroidota bacterium]